MNFLREWCIADEKACKARWHGFKDGVTFRCMFCGHAFIIGDEYRALYTNDGRKDTYGGNPLTCRPCWDGWGGEKGLRKRWKVLHDSLPWWAAWTWEHITQ